MIARSLILSAALTAASSQAPADEAPPRPRGERRLAIDLNEAEGVDYDRAVSIARAAGAGSASVSLNWDQLEPRPGELVDPDHFLYLIDTYYPSKGLTVDLFIRPVDTDGRHVPPDLAGTPFDDPALIARFLKAMDFVLGRIPNARLNFLAIGNELTLAYPADAPFWAEYETLYRAAKAAVKQIRPEVRVGTVGTLYEVTGSHRDPMRRLNRHSDVVLVSYYPLEGDFSVKAPDVVAGDLARLARTYPDRTIYFSETGYPSSRLLGSSEQKQSEFVVRMFEAWDEHATQLPYISFTWLHDQSKAQLDQLERYYGSSDPRFRAYLATLGLRTRGGRDKPALRTLRQQARIRGWR